MPFTLAHPAAVLPLRHVRYLRGAPLIIGAMTPDLPYYFSTGLSGHVLRIETHSLVGSYTVDLPLGIAILVGLLLLRNPLTVLLPARARWLCLHALEPFRRSALEWVFAPFAVLIGVWSHLLWDSFTHGGTWAVRHFPVLGETITLGWYAGQISHILQYASSGVGLAIVVWWYARLRVPPAAHLGEAARRARAGPALLLVAGAALLIGGVEALLYYQHSDGAIYRTIDTFLTRGLGWFVVLDLFAGTVVELEHRAPAAGQQ
jgi:hypothetical protein